MASAELALNNDVLKDIGISPESRCGPSKYSTESALAFQEQQHLVAQGSKKMPFRCILATPTMPKPASEAINYSGFWRLSASGSDPVGISDRHSSASLR